MDAGIRPNSRFYRDVFGPSRIVSTLSSLTRASDRIEALSFSQKKKYRATLGVQPAHAGATRIKAFDPGAWEQHFKFCFVRNPFSRMVSYWRWHEGNREKAGKAPRGFKDFLWHLTQDDNLIADAFEMYSIDGQLSVDYVGRFENLLEDMRQICNAINIPFNENAFPHAKRGRSLTYRDFYGVEERQIVEKLSQREIDAFRYVF